MLKSISKDTLIRFGASNGAEWKFIPADAPWQNGMTESLVKSVKGAIHHVVDEQELTFGELQSFKNIQIWLTNDQLGAILLNRNRIWHQITYFLAELLVVFLHGRSRKAVQMERGLSWFRRSQLIFGKDGSEILSKSDDSK